jgi:hypothetical protein
MGMVAVARRAASRPVVPATTSTSTGRRTSSAARAGSRSRLPSAPRGSKITVRPSTYPSSRIPWRKASQRRARPAIEPRSRSPIRGVLAAGCASAARGAARRVREPSNHVRRSTTR